MTVSASRVLIFRLGSLGDTIVSVPAFHLIECAFPDAERWVLTNLQTDRKAVTVVDVLAGTGLVHGSIRYPLRTRDPRDFIQLRNAIRAFHPDVLIYLTEPRGWLRTLRDAAFFRLCGIHRLIGLPMSRDLRHRRRSADGTAEFEGLRLMRCIESLGSVDPRITNPFDLRLTEHERTAARKAVGSLPPTAPMLAVSIAAKVDVNDWGDESWSSLLRRLSATLPGWALVVLGAGVERERSERLLANWQSRGLNLCGKLSVRESAAVLEQARVFVGHDSGPLHLAAAVGTRCVGIFSSRNLPGEWFPLGHEHRIIYTDIPCRGCRLHTCVQYNKACIAAIRVDDVIHEIEDALSTRSNRAPIFGLLPKTSERGPTGVRGASEAEI